MSQSNTQLAVAKQNTAMVTIRDMLDKNKAVIAQALPKHLNADRVIRVAMTSLRRTPQLLECDPVSLVGAIIQSSQLGLEPDGILGHAHLVPFRNNKKGIMEVQFIPGYKGLIELARRSGQVVSIAAHCVFENEPFILKYGHEEKLEHSPLPPSQRGDRRVGVYAMARLKDGSVHHEFLWSEEVETIKKQAKAKDFGPWVTHEEEMWRKTAIRRLAKYLPLSVEFAKAAAFDELSDAGISTRELFDEESEISITRTAKPTIEEAISRSSRTRKQEEPEVQVQEEETSQAQQTIEAVPEASTAPQTDEEIRLETIRKIKDLQTKHKLNGSLVAFVIRATGAPKMNPDNWTLDDAARILAEIQRVKGIEA